LAGGSDGSLASDNLGRTDAVVLKYDPDGNLLDSIQFGGPLHDIIFHMAIDGFGNVYVGGGQRIVNQNNSPHNGWLVKLTPVPEPSTYVLAAIGFVALLAMRRRKIQAA
jgi:hypothetical protein